MRSIKKQNDKQSGIFTSFSYSDITEGEHIPIDISLADSCFSIRKCFNNSPVLTLIFILSHQPIHNGIKESIYTSIKIRSDFSERI